MFTPFLEFISKPRLSTFILFNNNLFKGKHLSYDSLKIFCFSSVLYSAAKATSNLDVIPCHVLFVMFPIKQ